jgi:hypothetical protein
MCPSKPPATALPPWGHLTLEDRKPVATAASFASVAIVGPGALQ